MNRHFFLLLTCLSLTRASYAGEYNGNAPLFDGESWRWINMNLVLFVGGFLLFLYIVRRLYEARLRMSDKNSAAAASAKKDNIYVPRHWYQCKNCGLTIRKDSPPKSAECYKAPTHLWTQLGEIGTNKYLCKNCNTLVETRTVPATENCMQADLHNWELLQ
jgi:hypothetical protein